MLSDTNSMLTQTLGALFVVIALGYAVLHLSRKNLGATLKSPLHMKLIGSIHVSPKDKVLVLRVENRRLVLSQGPHGIRYLTELAPVAAPCDDEESEGAATQKDSLLKPPSFPTAKSNAPNKVQSP